MSRGSTGRLTYVHPPGVEPVAPLPVLVVLHAPLTSGELAGLCEQAIAGWRDGAGGLLICDLSGVVDLSVVAAVARLHLLSRRAGGSLRLRCAAAELAGLLDLLELAGLAGLAGLAETLGEPLGRC